mgnify:FL=1
MRALVLCCHSYGIYWMVVAYTAFMILWLLVWQGAIRHITGLRFRDVCLDTLPFLFCAAGCMVATYYLTCWLSNIYLLLLVRIILASSLYFAVMKLLRVKILEECLTFMKKKKK